VERAVSRQSERQVLNVDTRLLLAERDLDEHENELRTFDDRLGKMLGILIGILVSTTTAAVLLALNILVSQR
jgi:hypothetical protein